MAFSSIASALGHFSPVALALTATAGIVVTVAAREFWSWYRLRHVPGPFFHSISIYPMNKLTMSGRMCFTLRDMQTKYGPLMRVGPNEVMFGDAETYRKLSGVRSDYFKGPWYSTARVLPDTDSLFSMCDEDSRKVLRTKLTPSYSGSSLGGFEPGIDAQVAQFINLVESKYISTPEDYRPIEFAHKAQYFALDVISALGYSQPIGFLKNDMDMHKYIEINDESFKVFALMSNMPWLAAMMRRWPLNLALPKDSDPIGFGRLLRFVAAVVDKRLEAGDTDSSADMMHLHMRAGLTRNELLAETVLEMIAGSDTTATAIRMTMLCLLNTPAAIHALQREIDEGVAAGVISSPIRDAEARKLPYLQAVIREGMRVYPPQTGFNYKEVPRGGATVHGHRLPAGTQVGVGIQSITRSFETFGPDADVFRPERWIEAAKEDENRFKDMAASVDLVFGHGKFQCLGKTIAAIELNKLLVELLRRYDFAIVNPPEPMKLWDASFWITTDFWLRATRRENAV